VGGRDDPGRTAGRGDELDRLGLAIKLLRTYTKQMEALQRYRGKGQQKVTVEHVRVHSGGQAIVGTVSGVPAKCTAVRSRVIRWRASFRFTTKKLFLPPTPSTRRSIKASRRYPRYSAGNNRVDRVSGGGKC
jgi:hypothetical protein